MAKRAQAQAGDMSRLEMSFDKPHLINSVFGEFDRNLVTIENRLGVYISARGNRVQIEGEAESAARARDSPRISSSIAHWMRRCAYVSNVTPPGLAAPLRVVVLSDVQTDRVGAYERRAFALAMAERPDLVLLPGDFVQVSDDPDHLGDVAVVVRSAVDYRTAEVADVAGETARAGAAGAMVVWDLSHAAGVLAVDLGAAGAQLAVGCTYKYLNGGPGAPAFSYVARELHETLPQPIWGWFAQADQFAMGPTFMPQPDIRRVLLGTPSILALAAADEGIGVTIEAGIEMVAAKAQALTGFGLELCDQLGLRSSTPRDAARRGGHIAVHHPNAMHLVADLAQHGVITDFRDPDIVRLGCSPLTTRFTDVFDGLAAVADRVD